MFNLFTRNQSVREFYVARLKEIELRLEGGAYYSFLQYPVDEIVTRLCSWNTIRPITIDNSRQPISIPSDLLDKNQIYLPLVPQENDSTLREYNSLRFNAENSKWPTNPIKPFEAEIDEDFRNIILTVPINESIQKYNTLLQMINAINEDLDKYTPKFIEDVRKLVQLHKNGIEQRYTQLEQEMQGLGITLVKKGDAIEPINLEVKEEINILQEPPKRAHGPRENYLTKASLETVIGLIDRTSKLFEISPETYSKLEEDDLRNIIVNNLNAVFDRIVATGEAFSKLGHSDISLNVGQGHVLVGECKIWDGVEYTYGKGLPQLFGYLTWRHNYCLLITFSKNKSLTNVVNQAVQYIEGHTTYVPDTLAREFETYFVSTHIHPDDAEKTVEVHHLFFNLYVDPSVKANMPDVGKSRKPGKRQPTKQLPESTLIEPGSSVTKEG